MGKKFSSDHVWIEVENGVTRVGITEHAQDALGDIVFVQLPKIGEEFAKSGVLAVIESVKAAADVLIPAGARVIKLNDQLKDNPALVNSDPLGLGWLVEVELITPNELDSLMGSVEYLNFCKKN